MGRKDLSMSLAPSAQTRLQKTLLPIELLDLVFQFLPEESHFRELPRVSRLFRETAKRPSSFAPSWFVDHAWEDEDKKRLQIERDFSHLPSGICRTHVTLISTNLLALAPILATIKKTKTLRVECEDISVVPIQPLLGASLRKLIVHALQPAVLTQILARTPELVDLCCSIVGKGRVFYPSTLCTLQIDAMEGHVSDFKTWPRQMPSLNSLKWACKYADLKATIQPCTVPAWPSLTYLDAYYDQRCQTDNWSRCTNITHLSLNANIVNLVDMPTKHLRTLELGLARAVDLNDWIAASPKLETIALSLVSIEEKKQRESQPTNLAAFKTLRKFTAWFANNEHMKQTVRVAVQCTQLQTIKLSCLKQPTLPFVRDVAATWPCLQTLSLSGGRIDVINLLIHAPSTLRVLNVTCENPVVGPVPLSVAPLNNLCRVCICVKPRGPEVSLLSQLAPNLTHLRIRVKGEPYETKATSMLVKRLHALREIDMMQSVPIESQYEDDYRQTFASCLALAPESIRHVRLSFHNQDLIDSESLLRLARSTITCSDDFEGDSGSDLPSWWYDKEEEESDMS